MSPMLAASLFALVSAGALGYGAWLSHGAGRRQRAVFRAAYALWFGRYAVSLAAAATDHDTLSVASQPWVILASNVSIALAVLVGLGDWRREAA